MRPDYRHEEGASLLMVVVFVMIFSLVIGAILHFASTGLNLADDVAATRDQQHSADGAVDGAINAIRRDANAGATVNQPCVVRNGVTKHFEYDGTDAGDDDVTVTCTGLDPSTSTERLEQPKYAVLTLSPDECEGFLQKGQNPSQENWLTIRGGIFSMGRIAVGREGQNSACGSSQNDNSPELKVIGGPTYAREGCTPWVNGTPTRIFATGDLNCETSATEDDQGYKPVVESITGMTIDPAVTCPGAGVAVFSPGVYTELPTEHATRANCGRDVWWFQKGVYYFDFPAGSDVWDWGQDGDKKTIVGGTLRSGLTQNSAASLFTLPGACDPDEEGVQFIFGGEARLQSRSSNAPGSYIGDMELCGAAVADVPIPSGATRTTEKQHIAVYGLDADYDERDENNPDTTLYPGTTATATAGTWTGATDALAAGGSYAGASLRGDGTKTASLKVTGFDIEDGSTVTSVRVRARYEVTGDTSKVDPKITIRTPSMNQDQDFALAQMSAFENLSDFNSPTHTSNNYPEITAELDDIFRYKDVEDLELTFTADGGDLGVATGQACTGQGANRVCPVDTADVHLDALIIEVTYIPPGFEPLSCPSSDPECVFLTTNNNPRVLFEGTVYVPTGRFDIWLQNGTDQIFKRGIIAWDIVAKVNSSTQTESPFQLPGAAVSRVVLLKAYIGSVNNSNLRLIAKVQFADDDSTAGREVEILDWQVVRP